MLLVLQLRMDVRLPMSIAPAGAGRRRRGAVNRRYCERDE